MLKSKTLVLLATLLVAVSGCIIPSLHPIFNESDLITNDQLKGDWLGHKSIWTFEEGDNKSYRLYYKECDDPVNDPSNYATCTMAEFKSHLIKLDGAYFLDFYPVNYKNTENQFLRLHLQPLHSFAKVTIEKDHIEVSFLNYLWLKELLDKNPKAVAHTETRHGIMLTADTDELQQFMKTYADEKAYVDPVVLHKAATE